MSNVNCIEEMTQEELNHIKRSNFFKDLFNCLFCFLFSPFVVTYKFVRCLFDEI